VFEPAPCRSGAEATALRLWDGLVAVGTGPRGADMTTSKSAEIFAATYDPPEHLWLAVHFSPSASSRAAGLAFLKRKHLRKDRDPEGIVQEATAQREAIAKYTERRQGALDYLKDIGQPTLIVQGSNLIIIATANSYVLQQNLPNTELIPHPDANLGSLYHYPEPFVSQADQFFTSCCSRTQVCSRPNGCHSPPLSPSTEVSRHQPE
jgi:pimeloyl-ACP methyl ester carboxylesterase